MNLNVPSKNKRNFVLVAIPVIVIGLAVWAWFGLVRYNVIPRNFGVVIPGHIYRSGQISAMLIKKILTKYDIKVIIDLTPDNPKNRDKQAEKQAVAELNIKLLRFPMKGNGTGDVNDYAAAVAAIADTEKQNLPVLVHCAAGAARTGGVIATYRLLVQKIAPDIVVDEMGKYGYPIHDKKRHLLPFLNQNMAEFAIRLKQAGVIEEIPDPLPQIPGN